MKKTNVILAIVIGIFAICAVTILILAIMNSKDEDSVPVNVDFAALSSNIEESTSFESDKMESITIEDLEEDFNIKPEWVEQVIGQKPYLNVTSNMFVIVEATEGNIDNIVSAFEAYGNTYDEMWKDYLPAGYELVKDRLVGSKGNYAYFIVDDSATVIVDLIK